MMKLFLILFLSIFVHAHTAAQSTTGAVVKCQKYETAMKRGDDCLNNADYGVALKHYLAAQIAARECRLIEAEAPARIDSIYKLLNNQVKVAEQSKRNAEISERAAKAAFAKAEINERIAETAAAKADSSANSASSMAVACLAYVSIYKTNDLVEGFTEAKKAYEIDPNNILAISAIYASVYGDGRQSNITFPELSIKNVADNIKNVVFNGDSELITFSDAEIQCRTSNNKDCPKYTIEGEILMHPDSQEVTVFSDSKRPDRHYDITTLNIRTGTRTEYNTEQQNDLYFDKNNSSIFSKNKKTLISISGRSINLWNTEKWNRVARIELPWEYGAPFIFNSSRIGALDKVLLILDALSGRILDTVRTDSFTNYILSPDKNYFFMTFANNTAILYNLISKQKKTFSFPSDITFADISPDNNYLFVAFSDSTARLYNIILKDDSAEKYSILPGKLNNNPVSIQFAPGRRKMAIAFDNQTVGVLDMDKKTFDLCSENATSAFFSPLNNKLITVFGNTIKVWDSTNLIIPNSTLSGNKHHIYKFGCSADGKKVWAVTINKELKLWAIDTISENGSIRGIWDNADFAAFSAKEDKVFALKENTGRIQNIENPVNAIVVNELSPGTKAAFSTGGRHLITISKTGLLKVWQATDGALICSAIVKNNNVYQFQFSRDNRVFCKLYKNPGTRKDTLFLANTTNGFCGSIGIDSISATTFSSNGDKIMVLQENGRVTIFHTKSLEQIRTSTISDYYSSIFPRNGDYFILKTKTAKPEKVDESEKKGKTAKVGSSVENGQSTALINIDKYLSNENNGLIQIKNCDTAFFSSDGKKLLSIKDTASIFTLEKTVDSVKIPYSTFNIRTGSDNTSLKAAFSPDNNIIILSGRYNADMLVGDTGSTRPINGFKSVTFSRNGNFALVNSKNFGELFLTKTIHKHISNTSPGLPKPICTYPKMDTAIFSPDEKYLLTKYNNSFKLWSVPRADSVDNLSQKDFGRELTTMPIGAAIRYTFSQDSKRIMANYPNGKVKIWYIDPNKLIQQMEEKLGN